MLSAVFVIGLLINGLVALLSRSAGLQKLSLLMIANYALCNAVASLLNLPAPQRMAVFAVTDLLTLGLSIYVMLSNQILPKLRWGVIAASVGMLCAHVTVLMQPKLSFGVIYAYDAILNVLFVAQVCICVVGGGLVVGKLLDRHGLPDRWGPSGSKGALR